MGVLAILLLGACDLLDVTNPGPIIDEALNQEAAGKTVLLGIVSDVEVSLDNYAYFGGVASTDMTSDATRPWVQAPGDGLLQPVDGANQWDDGARAQWTAEAGIQRLMETQPNASSSPLVAAAYIWAGYANRILGDNVCVAIFDGGPPLDSDEHYVKAIEYFQQGLSMAQSLGLDSLKYAAIAGMAQSNLILGNYGEAASLAAQVPDDFLWVGHRSDNSGREYNQIHQETFPQKQVTVWGTYSDSIGPDGDPRTPWQDMNQTAASGLKPFYRQLKYPERGSDIPLAKGPEMKLIRAEVLLRSNDMAGAVALINEVRTDAGVTPVAPATMADAWLTLDRERHLVLWLEARRLKDNTRFDDEGLSAWATAFLSFGSRTGGPRDRCFPPSQAEIDSNPNLTGWPM